MKVFISEHVSYKEAVYSYTAVRRGFNNTPGQLALMAMKNVARVLFEPVRNHFGVPIHVSSFFRGTELNKAIGGSLTSGHLMGEAMDLDADWYNKKLANGQVLTNRMIFDYIKDNLSFDQLIWEHGDNTNPAWVHIGYRSLRENRNQILRAEKQLQRNGEYKTVYINWDSNWVS